MAKKLILARYKYVNPNQYIGGVIIPVSLSGYLVQMIDKSTPVIICEISEHLHQSIVNFGNVCTVPVLDDGISIQALRVLHPEYVEALDACLAVVMAEYVKICEELEKIRLYHLGSESHNGICEGANKVIQLKNKLTEVMKMVELYKCLSNTVSEDDEYRYRLSLED